MKVVPVFMLIKYYAMKAYGGVAVQIHVSFTLILVGGEWPASRPCRLNLRERDPIPIVQQAV
jgi:hypothetical protein